MQLTLIDSRSRWENNVQTSSWKRLLHPYDAIWVCRIAGYYMITIFLTRTEVLSVFMTYKKSCRFRKIHVFAFSSDDCLKCWIIRILPDLILSIFQYQNEMWRCTISYFFHTHSIYYKHTDHKHFEFYLFCHTSGSFLRFVTDYIYANRFIEEIYKGL